MKKKKTNLRKIYLFLSLFFVSIVSISLAYITPGLKGSIDQEFRIFFKQSDRIFTGTYSEITSKLYHSLKYKIHNEYNYDEIKINISFKNFKTLKKEREKSLSRGFNLSRERVPAIIRYKGQDLPASVRLKGILTDHYGNNKQFSLRINIKKGNSIEGMREFSLTQHFSRQFPQNLVYSNLLAEQGIQSPNFKTFKVNLNGDDWGIMLAEEQYSDAYFELKEKKYSQVVKLTNEENLKVFRTLFNKFNKKEEKYLIDFLNSKHGRLENSYYNKKDFNNIYYHNLLSNFKDFKQNLVNNKIKSEIIHEYFDVEKFSKIFLLSLISGEYHPLAYRNIRFYINPFTTILEPIPTDWGEQKVRELLTDSQIEKELSDLINCHELCNRQQYPIYNLIIKNKSFVEHFYKNLDTFDDNFNSSKKHLAKLCQFQQPNCETKVNFKKLKKNILFLKNTNIEKIFYKNYFKENKFPKFDLKLNKDIINTYIEIDSDFVFARAFKDGKVDLVNLTPFDLNLNKIILEKDKKCKKDCKKEIVELNNEIIFSNFNFQPKKINIENISDFSFIIFEFNLKNKNKVSSKFRIEDNRFKLLKKREKFNLNKLRVSGKKMILEGNKIHINSPIILPKNYDLEILPGTQILFSKDSYIQVDGGNIIANGTKNQMITLTSKKDELWNGILIKNSKKKSEFNYVQIKNVKNFETFKTYLTGAINFYKSDISIKNSLFENSKAEDFINVTEANFLIKDSNFVNCLSDALDADFSDGKIFDSKFTNIQGDAVDFSGSKAEVTKSVFKAIGDKSISAGERSKIVLKNNFFKNSFIAIASKDKSRVKVEDSEFENSNLFDLVAFNKKSFYQKGGFIEVQSSSKKLKMKSDFMSKISVNGKEIKNERIDLRSIYN